MEEIEILNQMIGITLEITKFLQTVVPETTRHFARAMVMPNLVPPILNGKDAVQYKKRIKEAIPKNQLLNHLHHISN